MSHGNDNPDIKSTAIAWMTRRDAGLTPDEETAFDHWRNAAPENAEAIAELETAWAALDTPRATGMAEVVRQEIHRRARMRARRRRAIGLTGIATLALAAIFWQRPPADTPVAATARIVAPTREVLTDGSVAELHAGSQIETDFKAGIRQLRLIRGEGHFAVKSDPNRPFLVHAGPVTVRAVGTAFLVRIAADDVEVIVTEGRVSVERAPVQTPDVSTPAAALVDAGAMLVIPLSPVSPSPTETVALSPDELDQRLAWRTPRLEFTDTSIAEAVELFNRRNTVRLKTADRRVAELLVTGIFRADNVQGFVNVLEKSFGLRVDRTGRDEIVLHSAP
jgi:transmembrane sensor